MIRVSNIILLVFKGNPKAHFFKILDVLFWDLKGTMSSPFKVITGNHSHTIKIGRSKVDTTRSTIVVDLKPLSGISKSQMWVFVFKNSR